MAAKSVVINRRRLGPLGLMRELAWARRAGMVPESVFRLFRPYTVNVLSAASSILSETLSEGPARLWWERDGHRSFRPEFVADINRLLESSTSAHG